MTFKHKLIAGLTTACAALLLAAALSYLSLARNAEDRRWVTHTYVAIERLNDFQSSLIDAEISQRGYIISGDGTYLQVYTKNRDAAKMQFNRIREVTADNPNQLAAAAQLEPLLTARFEVMQSAMAARDKLGLEASAASTLGGSGKETMEGIRRAISNMKGEEARLLTIRSAELEISSRKADAFIVVGESLGFLFFLIAGLVIRQEMNRRARAEEAVLKLNTELEDKVSERTAELAERAKDLERSNLELQQFAYVASHDLQEPLRTISSFTQLLAKRYQDKLDDKAREFINFAVDGCKRMQTLINDLLAFSRVGTQGKPLVPVRCDDAVDRVLRALKLAIEDSGAVIKRDPLPVVLADEIQLCQLFQNLIGNAMKFKRGDKPQIHVSAEKNGGGWKIAVQDNGIGIDPEHNERIFVIFQRLHTKMQYPGTGIGLAICKKIAERHGGRIWVEPTPGGGSTFFFTIEDAGTYKSTEREPNELRVSVAAN